MNHKPGTGLFVDKSIRIGRKHTSHFSGSWHCWLWKNCSIVSFLFLQLNISPSLIENNCSSTIIRDLIDHIISCSIVKGTVEPTRSCVVEPIRSCVVEPIRSCIVEPTISLAYFYCSFMDIKKHNAHSSLSSLLTQLVGNFSSFSSQIFLSLKSLMNVSLATKINAEPK